MRKQFEDEANLPIFETSNEKKNRISHISIREGTENYNNPNSYKRVGKKKHKELLKKLKENNK